MRKREYHTIEALLADESFISYCFETDVNDIIEWEHWLLQQPDKRPLVASAKSLLLNFNRSLREEAEMQTALAHFKQLFISHTGEEPTPAPRRHLRRWLMSVSMVCLLATALIAGLHFYKQRSIPAVTYTLIQNQGEQRKHIKLADGTQVILNRQSSLQVPADYGKGQRRLLLQGEAWFDVAPDQVHPFITNTSQLAVTVLGTTFHVRAYADESAPQVSLVTGKVRVTNVANGREVILLPGEMTDGSLQKHPVDTLALRRWVNGQLTFSHTPVETALQQLGAWYHIPVKVSGIPPANTAINAEFKEESLSRAMELLAFSAGFHYTIAHDTVYVRFH